MNIYKMIYSLTFKLKTKRLSRLKRGTWLSYLSMTHCFFSNVIVKSPKQTWKSKCQEQCTKLFLEIYFQCFADHGSGTNFGGSRSRTALCLKIQPGMQLIHVQIHRMFSEEFKHSHRLCVICCTSWVGKYDGQVPQNVSNYSENYIYYIII